MVTAIFVLLYLSASSDAFDLFPWSHQAWIIPVSQDPASRKRYEKRKVMKNNMRKSVRR